MQHLIECDHCTDRAAFANKAWRLTKPKAHRLAHGGTVKTAKIPQVRTQEAFLPHLYVGIAPPDKLSHYSEETLRILVGHETHANFRFGGVRHNGFDAWSLVAT